MRRVRTEQCIQSQESLELPVGSQGDTGRFARVTASLCAASFFISVFAETKTEKEKLKAVKACAAAALALTVVFSAFTIGYLAKEEALTKTGNSVFDVADRYEDFISEYTTYAN